MHHMYHFGTTFRKKWCTGFGPFRRSNLLTTWLKHHMYHKEHEWRQDGMRCVRHHAISILLL